MSEEYLVQHCSPTLAGIKTGNLFSCCCSDRSDVNALIRRVNRSLERKGLRLLLLRWTDGRALFYLYRPERLRKDLQKPEAMELLQSAGYSDLTCSRCVGELIRRLKGMDGFPHEIGLFLSYPPEDVKGFIDHKGKNSKCTGCWKVYGDEKTARSLFNRYQKCTQCYLKQRQHGVPIERLAVAEGYR